MPSDSALPASYYYSSKLGQLGYPFAYHTSHVWTRLFVKRGTSTPLSRGIIATIKSHCPSERHLNGFHGYRVLFTEDVPAFEGKRAG